MGYKEYLKEQVDKNKVREIAMQTLELLRVGWKMYDAIKQGIKNAKATGLISGTVSNEEFKQAMSLAGKASRTKNWNDVFRKYME